MPRGRKAVKLIEAALEMGFPLTDAVARALGCSLTEFAGDRFTVQAVSMCLRSYENRVYPEIRDALAESLDVTRSFIDDIIERARSRQAVA